MLVAKDQILLCVSGIITVPSPAPWTATVGWLIRVVPARSRVLSNALLLPAV